MGYYFIHTADELRDAGAIQLVVDTLATLFRRYYTRLPQYSQMLGYCRNIRTYSRSKFPYIPGTFAEQLDYMHAARMGHGFKYLGPIPGQFQFGAFHTRIVYPRLPSGQAIHQATSPRHSTRSSPRYSTRYISAPWKYCAFREMRPAMVQERDSPSFNLTSFIHLHKIPNVPTKGGKHG